MQWYEWMYLEKLSDTIKTYIDSHPECRPPEDPETVKRQRRKLQEIIEKARINKNPD